MTRAPQLSLCAVSILTLLACSHASAEDRLAGARKNQQSEIAALFKQAKVSYPPKDLYLRAFKDEGDLELWAGPGGKIPLTRITTFAVCMKSGELGPKRQLGDEQVPEGFYKIDRFNARSNFHLSLGINYPNDSDRLLGTKGALGGDIFIHGSCVTIGCLPIQDEYIEKLYVIALDAKLASGRDIPVHIFPRRLDEAGLKELKAHAGDNQALFQFWQRLAPGYTAFEQTRRLPKIFIHPKTGAYTVTPQG